MHFLFRTEESTEPLRCSAVRTDLADALPTLSTTSRADVFGHVLVEPQMENPKCWLARDVEVSPCGHGGR